MLTQFQLRPSTIFNDQCSISQHLLERCDWYSFWWTATARRGMLSWATQLASP